MHACAIIYKNLRQHYHFTLQHEDNDVDATFVLKLNHFAKKTLNCAQRKPIPILKQIKAMKISRWMIVMMWML